jgi:subtilisin family serine protease
MVELAVARGLGPDEVRTVGRRLQGGGFRLDDAYPPVLLRGPRAHRETLDAAGVQIFVVRGLLPAEGFAELEKQGVVRRVWRDVEVEPFREIGARPRARRPGPEPPRPPGPPEPPLPPGPPVPPRPEPWPLPWKRKRPPRPPLGQPGPPAAVDCGAGPPAGTLAQAATYLGADQIWALGCRGTGVIVGIVDGGIASADRVNPQTGQPGPIPHVVGGWPADWGTDARGWGEHGNMTATDVLGIAPDVGLWDIRIWQAETGNPATDFAGFVSNALAGYRVAIDSFEAGGGPHILNNSWGLRDRNNGLAYATDPASPFTLIVEEALDAGMLVLFAAGNCGAGCPFPAGSRCGAADRGPGQSILGPNGHPRVLTIGAANLREEWCGYTSQGPAVLPPGAAKPDVSGLAQFAGYYDGHGSPGAADAGTSAATAIASGVVALLRQRRPGLTQEEARTALRTTARDIRAPGFDMDSGAGIIRARAAFDALP